MSYMLYATGNNGDGYCESIGIYEDPEDIKIRVGLFKDDVVLTVVRHSDVEGE